MNESKKNRQFPNKNRTPFQKSAPTKVLLASYRSFTVLKFNANNKVITVTGILLHSTYTLLTLHIQFNAAWSIIPKAVFGHT